MVENLNRKHRINVKFVARLVKDILKIIKKPQKTQLEVIFLNDAGIKPFNKKYKHRDRATDVLSFNLGSCGEILISSDTALRNSRVFNTKFEDELVRYVIHGILHFFGYEDGTPGQRKRMSKKEDAILERLCTQTDLSKVLMRQ